MQKILKIVILTSVLIFTGCTNTLETVGDFTTNLISPVPEDIRGEALGRINQELEIAVFGSAVIGDSGIKLAEPKAMREAKDRMKVEIKKEAEIQIRAFIMDQDSHTKKILDPVIGDIAKYVVEREINKVQERGYWNDSRKVYTLLTISRRDVKVESEKAFNEYVKELGNRIKSSAVLESF